MAQPLESIANLIRFNTQALTGAVQDFSADDWQHRAGEANPALWIVGHVVASRRALVREFGGSIEQAPWEDAFQMGAKPGDCAGEVPSGELVEDLQRVGELLHERLLALTAEQAAAPRATPFEAMGQTNASYILFALWHESYHLGQLGLIRRVLGREGLA